MQINAILFCYLFVYVYLCKQFGAVRPFLSEINRIEHEKETI